MKNRIKKFLALLLVFAMILPYVHLTPIYAESASDLNLGVSEETISHEVNLEEYIVLDLGKGNITITATGYTGWEWTSGGSLVYAENKASNGNKYYIIQSTENITASVADNILTTPAYKDIENVINQTDVEGVATAWDEAALSVGREFVGHRIKVTASNSLDVTVVLDDVWTTNQIEDGTYIASNDANGGFVFDCSGNITKSKVTVMLRGDNRMRRFYYCSYAKKTDSSDNRNYLLFDNFDDDIKLGSLTVIGAQDKFYNNGSYIANSAPGGSGNVGYNNWASVMGADDSSQEARGFVFNGGCIYVGAGKYENCSAIGGGGNGYADITIAGGIVTAVAHTTGTAIGGGIGHNSAGGGATVNISGGNVHAYNFGIAANGWVKSYGTSNPAIIAAASHIPGAAIGGGSSIHKKGEAATVNISGGTVYAESLGGCAIGGGSSIVESGGTGIVNISGGIVTARSTGAVLDFEPTTAVETFKVSSSTAIGGGFSAIQSGGSTTVTVSGGTIAANGIGGGFSDKYGYNTGTVTITGGSLNSSMAAIPTDGNETVFLTRVSFVDRTVTKTNAKINSLEQLSIARTNPYGLEDCYTDEIGMAYFWLPSTMGVSTATLVEDFSKVYTPIYEDDGVIHSKEIGMVLTEDSEKQYIVNIASTEYYDMYRNYSDKTLKDIFSGTIIVPKGEFTCYLDVQSGWSMTPYLEFTSSDGTKTLQPADNILTLVEGNIYKLSLNVYRDTRVWFMLTSASDSSVKYFTVDLTSGDVKVTQNSNGSITVQQGDFVISDFSGTLYLTSAGYPTENQVNVQVAEGATPPEGKTIDIYINDIAAESSRPILSVESGDVRLSFGEKDNIMKSTAKSGVSPIYVEQEGSLNIVMSGKESVKIDGAEGQSAISGEGSVSITDGDGGFLKLNETSNSDKTVSNLAVGEYIYSGNNAKYTATLYDGNYSYTMIGYISNGKLYDKNNINFDNKESFSARGILEAYNEVYLYESYQITDGNLVFTLKVEKTGDEMGTILVQDKNGTSVQFGGDTTDAQKTKVTIAASAFESGNLKVMAAPKGKIPYYAQGYSGEFDDGDHTILLEFDTTLFDVVYGTTTIIEDGKETPVYNLTEPPKYKDVDFGNDGTADINTIYFKITLKKGVQPGENETYQDAFGHVTIEIKTAQNYWVEPLTCNREIVVGGNPSPKATSAWGDVSYTYWDMEGNPVNDFNNAGQYRVTATVEPGDHMNYTDLTDTIRFFVYAMTVYTAQGRQLDKLTSGNPNIEIINNDAFTVYFASPVSDFGLTTTVNLPIGTKITLIEIEQNGNIFYYYCQLNKATNVLTQDFFIKMSQKDSNDSVLQPKEQSTYQFCFDFSEVDESSLLRKLFYINLWEYKATITPAFTNKSLFDEFKQESSNDDAVWLTMKLQVSGPYHKILSFVSTAKVNAELYRSENGTDTIIAPSYSNGYVFCYSIGDMSANGTMELKLKLTSTAEVETSITGNIRLIDANVDAPYVMGNPSDTNTKRAEIKIPRMATTDVLAVELVSPSSRIITNVSGSLEFRTNIADGTLTVIPQRKVNSGYETLLMTQSLIVQQNTFSVDIDGFGSLANGITEPTIVRLVFMHGDSVCNYNLILLPLAK
ncbi:MAG: hypothetical protein IJ489_04315 [Clostridia bacterium]|nr:hypothetical protein [Clostridia bacterium]